MKRTLAILLLFYLNLGVVAPSLHLIFPDIFAHQITYMSSEMDSEIDEKESDKKILQEIKATVPSDLSNFSRLIYFDQNLYVSIDQKYFSPPPEVS